MVPGGPGTTQHNSDLNAQNLNMGNEMEGLTVEAGSPNLVDCNGGPVKSSDVANNAVESSEVV